MSDAIHVVGGAIVRNGAILAAQRGPGMSLEGQWEFPGGKVEPGESPEESLRRELQEELAVETVVGDFIARGTSEQTGRLIRLDVYWCELVEGKPVAHEHAELRWLAVDDIWSVEWAEADVPIVRAIEAALTK